MLILNINLTYLLYNNYIYIFISIFDWFTALQIYNLYEQFTSPLTLIVIPRNKPTDIFFKVYVYKIHIIWQLYA